MINTIDHRWLLVVLALSLGVGLLGTLGLRLAGYDPFAIALIWWHGAVGSPLRMAITLQQAGPLLLAALAAAIPMRAGVLNIGGEGQFLIGAVAFTAAAGGSIPLVPALLMGAFAGAGWALIAGVLERWRGVPVVLGTILLNFIAVLLVSWLVEGPLRDPATTAPQTAPLLDAWRLPVLMAGTRLHLGVVVAFVLALAWWIIWRRTVFGYELTVIGANAEAAAVAGIPVTRRRLEALAIGGACAGIAGAVQIAGVSGFLGATPASYGYLGVAVALLGGLHPGGVMGAALLFAMLDTGARAVERQAGIPRELGDVVMGGILLAVLVMTALAAQRGVRRH